VPGIQTVLDLRVENGLLQAPCDPQIFHFRPQMASANLPTLTNDVKGLHVAACQFSKLFKHCV
jgi:hypothetical protein